MMSMRILVERQRIVITITIVADRSDCSCQLIGRGGARSPKTAFSTRRAAGAKNDSWQTLQRDPGRVSGNVGGQMGRPIDAVEASALDGRSSAEARPGFPRTMDDAGVADAFRYTDRKERRDTCD